MGNALILACLLLTGCASLPREQAAYEATYQALHAIDTLQTLDIKRHDWAYERNAVLGRHPKDAEVLAYMAAEAGLHYMVTSQLADHNAPMWLQRTWHYASIGYNGATVRANYRLGLKVRF